MSTTIFFSIRQYNYISSIGMHTQHNLTYSSNIFQQVCMWMAKMTILDIYGNYIIYKNYIICHSDFCKHLLITIQLSVCNITIHLPKSTSQYNTILVVFNRYLLLVLHYYLPRGLCCNTTANKRRCSTQALLVPLLTTYTQCRPLPHAFVSVSQGKEWRKGR